mmetsp:Transcript_4214/g.6182  ORF Transcript_4214/g.6182 Transcript_4214/m.6182 type:complete len:271 (+) Transcript_4214:411-1223(+)
MELGSSASLRVEAASARADNDRAHQARHAADHVHDARAGEVDQAVGGAVLVEHRAGDAVLVGVGAPGREPATAPSPVHNHRVDEGGEHDRVHEVGLELGALAHASSNDRRAGASERPLEEPGLPTVAAAAASAVVDVSSRELAASEDTIRAATDEATLVHTVSEAPAEKPEAKGSDRGIDHVLEQDVGHVLRVHDAGLKHGEAALHEEDQGTAGHEPPDVHVAGVALSLSSGGVDLSHQVILPPVVGGVELALEEGDNIISHVISVGRHG